MIKFILYKYGNCSINNYHNDNNDHNENRNRKNNNAINNNSNNDNYNNNNENNNNNDSKANNDDNASHFTAWESPPYHILPVINLPAITRVKLITCLDVLLSGNCFLCVPSMIFFFFNGDLFFLDLLVYFYCLLLDKFSFMLSFF